MSKMMMAWSDIREEYIDEAVTVYCRKRMMTRTGVRILAGLCAMLCIFAVIGVAGYFPAGDSPVRIYWLGDTVETKYGIATYVELTETTLVLDLINTSDGPYILHASFSGGGHWDKVIYYVDGEKTIAPRIWSDGKTHRIVIDYSYFKENGFVLKSCQLEHFGHFSLTRRSRKPNNG